MLQSLLDNRFLALVALLPALVLAFRQARSGTGGPAPACGCGDDACAAHGRAGATTASPDGQATARGEPDGKTTDRCDLTGDCPPREGHCAEALGLLAEPLAIAIWALVLARLVTPWRFVVAAPGWEMLLLDSGAPLALAALMVLGMAGCLGGCGLLAPWAAAAGLVADPGLLSLPLLAGGAMGFRAAEGLPNLLVFLLLPALWTTGRRPVLRPLTFVTGLLFLGLLPVLILFMAAGALTGRESASPAREAPRWLLLAALLGAALTLFLEEGTGLARAWATLGGIGLFAGLAVLPTPAAPSRPRFARPLAHPQAADRPDGPAPRHSPEDNA